VGQVKGEFVISFRHKKLVYPCATGYYTLSESLGKNNPHGV